MAVQQNLLLLEDDQFRIRLYYREGHTDLTKEMFKVDDVILIANIAARKINLKVDRVVKEKGVLHAIVGFLPRNLKIEGQAFQRISRQSHNGSA